MNYNDIIEIRGTKAVYNLEDETANEWKSFIPNDSFNTLLGKTTAAISNLVPDMHKSIWLYGSFGTGKSHSAAVLKHLFCDDINSITDWLDDATAKTNLPQYKAVYDIRKTQQLFPVFLYGLEGITQSTDLPTILQARIQRTLLGNGINIQADTVFDIIRQHIINTPEVWDGLLNKEQQTALTEKLRLKDTTALAKATSILRDANISIRIDSNKLKDWLTAIQTGLRQNTEYTGLLIIWDEFTDVMNEPFALPVLKQLQEIAELFMNGSSSSFLFLISHPYAFGKLDAQNLEQTNGRYHMVRYLMPSNSVLDILYNKFFIKDTKQHSLLAADILTYAKEAPDSFSSLSYFVPFHPYTLLLLSFYAANAGSSSRNAFEFFGQNKDITAFLNSEEHFNNHDLITPDFLFDFILEELKKNNNAFGIVMERYYNNIDSFQDKPMKDYMPIFKTMLLLNAMQRIPNVTQPAYTAPSARNIKLSFAGTRLYDRIDEALNNIDKSNIVNRDQDNNFPVLFSQFPLAELNSKKNKLSKTEFADIAQVIELSDEANNIIRFNIAAGILQPVAISTIHRQFYIETQAGNKQNGSNNYKIHFAILFAKDKDEIQSLKKRTISACASGTLPHTIFVIPDEPMGDERYNAYINFMALNALATERGKGEQANTHSKSAEAIVAKWMNDLIRNTATILCGPMEPVSLNIRDIAAWVNNIGVKRIFPYAPTAYKPVVDKAPAEFWGQRNSKNVIRSIIFAKSIRELKFSTIIEPVYALLDCLNDDFTPKQDADKSAPAVAITKFVKETLDKIKPRVLFNLADALSPLTQPPFGLYTSISTSALLAVAMKPYIGKITDSAGAVIPENNMVNIISVLMKTWDAGKHNKDLDVYMLADRESDTCEKLLTLFDVKKKGTKDISSSAARWTINAHVTSFLDLPLWLIKYTPTFLTNNKPLSKDAIDLINNINTFLTNPYAQNLNTILAAINKGIDNAEDEVRPLLSSKTAVTEGFNNFAINNNIPESSLPELMAYVRTNMPSDAFYWQEQDLAQVINGFTPGQPVVKQQYANLSGIDLVNAAKDIINNTTDIFDLQRMLSQICDLQNNDVLNIILRNNK